MAQAFLEEYARILAEKGNLPPIPAAEQDVRAAGAAPVERLALLERLGVLSEQEVRHPELPLLGIIDLLVRRDGQTTVLDFKTGASRPEYRRQIQLYALLWWRSTGDLPAHVELRYGARVEGWPVSADELCRLEEELAVEIAAHTRRRRRRRPCSTSPVVALALGAPLVALPDPVLLELVLERPQRQ